jgi:uncharacterized small protein (DUF1192 family)
VTIAVAAAIFTRRREWMTDEDLVPKKKPTHEIGQDLALLSLNELAERIAALKGEIARLEQAIASKRASADAANAFFKR